MNLEKSWQRAGMQLVNKHVSCMYTKGGLCVERLVENAFDAGLRLNANTSRGVLSFQRAPASYSGKGVSIRC